MEWTAATAAPAMHDDSQVCPLATFGGQCPQHHRYAATLQLDWVGPSQHLVRVIYSDGSQSQQIHRFDADPEHRFLSYRFAAAWFEYLRLAGLDVEECGGCVNGECCGGCPCC